MQTPSVLTIANLIEVHVSAGDEFTTVISDVDALLTVRGLPAQNRTRIRYSLLEVLTNHHMHNQHDVKSILTVRLSVDNGAVSFVVDGCVDEDRDMNRIRELINVYGGKDPATLKHYYQKAFSALPLHQSPDSAKGSGLGLLTIAMNAKDNDVKIDEASRGHYQMSFTVS